ncbi:DUF3618 domain-containing protein [Epidermidibacterium keratini]|uniref:DUF3618 domain-containing protein n=1 Tax=Epidermidibacterium keratini TaxID=1891644 RepID=A0A7L4YK05_9ACTN|nr:DUF3618 domain-containing protein [Epidermidibacterium keratini]QHB99439.1 DUF3618 domain-containing protein [Epidermidibacterium keratini]
MADRTPSQIQADIDRTRDQLAGTLDQIAERVNPKRLVEDGKQTVTEFFASPTGKAVLAGAGGLLALLIGRRIALGRRNKAKREIEFLHRYGLLDSTEYEVVD